MFLSLSSLLWLVPVTLVVILGVLWGRHRRIQALSGLSGLKTNASPRRRKILTWALVLSLILSGLAILRPYGGTILSEHRKPAKNLILLVDVSPSMAVNDARNLTRMEAAKLYVREFVEQRPTDRIGMISFAGAAFPECPTTLERSMLLKRLDVLEPGSLPVGGTNFSVALTEANQLLGKNPPPGSAIVILSDGDNIANDPTEALAAITEKKVPIFTLAIGIPEIESPIPGTNLRSAAHHEILLEIAAKTGGTSLIADPDTLTENVQTLVSHVDAIELFGEDISSELYNRPLELYHYPLTASLLLLMIHLALPLRTKRWHPLAPVLTLCLVLSPPTKAQDEETEAKEISGYAEALELARTESLPLVLHFTGSDWSKQSITFEREILEHPVYRNWEETSVVARLIDLPRTGISSARRAAHRVLARRFGIVAYPTSIFLDSEQEEELGRLGHDASGPAIWVRRAKAILSGDEAASDLPTAVEYLPEGIRESLQNPKLTKEQRARGYYNKGIETERAEPDLVFMSADRFDLLLDLYGRAAAEAEESHPDIRFQALMKSGTLHHLRARKAVPDLPEHKENEQTASLMQQLTKGRSPEGLFKGIIQTYDKALAEYRKAAPLKPGDSELSQKLAALYRDRKRAQDYLAYVKAFDQAVTNTSIALNQETRLRRSLDHAVTSTAPLNREMITDSQTSIEQLIETSEAIQEPPTILELEKLAEFRLALEDIVLAPSPHLSRNLHPSTQHIKNALEHLIDPRQLQQMSGSGEGEPDEGKEPGEELGDLDEGTPDDLQQQEAPGEKDREAELRRAEREQGDLRERLLERMKQGGQKVPPHLNK